MGAGCLNEDRSSMKRRSVSKNTGSKNNIMGSEGESTANAHLPFLHTYIYHPNMSSNATFCTEPLLLFLPGRK